MPYNDAQVRLLQGVKHGSIQRKGLSSQKAAKMLSESGNSGRSGHERKSSAASKLSGRY